MIMKRERNKGRGRWLTLWLLAGGVVVFEPRSYAQTAEGDVRRDATVLAVEKVMPTVVNIATETIIQVRDPFEEFFRQFWGPYHRQQPPNSQYSLGSGEKVMPTVVNIATETIIQVRDPFEEFFRQFWGPYHRQQPPNSQYSLGSGVVIDEAGYLLTNDHVVRRGGEERGEGCAGSK